MNDNNDVAKENPMVFFIDDIDTSKNICKTKLLHHNLIGVDLEGYCLGKECGIISLIQISVSSDEVYIFDVMALKNELFDASNLLPILSNPCVVKLCYDCRCDCEALFLQYGVQVFGFYDLQIAYTILYQSYGDPYLKGLHKALQTPELQYSKQNLQHKLDKKKSWSINQGLEFLKRPLSKDITEYCSMDVTCLFTMYNAWYTKLFQPKILFMTHQRLIKHIYFKKPWYTTPADCNQSSNNNHNCNYSNSCSNNSSAIECMSKVDFYFPFYTSMKTKRNGGIHRGQWCSEKKEYMLDECSITATSNDNISISVLNN